MMQASYITADVCKYTRHKLRKRGSVINEEPHVSSTLH